MLLQLVDILNTQFKLRGQLTFITETFELLIQLLLVRERSALADPYCHLAWNSLCMYVCMYVGVCVRDSEVKYLGNQRS